MSQAKFTPIIQNLKSPDYSGAVNAMGRAMDRNARQQQFDTLREERANERKAKAGELAAQVVAKDQRDAKLRTLNHLNKSAESIRPLITQGRYQEASTFLNNFIGFAKDKPGFDQELLAQITPEQLEAVVMKPELFEQLQGSVQTQIAGLTAPETDATRRASEKHQFDIARQRAALAKSGQDLQKGAQDLSAGVYENVGKRREAEKTFLGEVTGIMSAYTGEANPEMKATRAAKLNQKLDEGVALNLITQDETVQMKQMLQSAATAENPEEGAAILQNLNQELNARAMAAQDPEFYGKEMKELGRYAVKLSVEDDQPNKLYNNPSYLVNDPAMMRRAMERKRTEEQKDAEARMQAGLPLTTATKNNIQGTMRTSKQVLTQIDSLLKLPPNVFGVVARGKTVLFDLLSSGLHAFGVDPPDAATNFIELRQRLLSEGVDLAANILYNRGGKQLSDAEKDWNLLALGDPEKYSYERYQTALKVLRLSSLGRLDEARKLMNEGGFRKNAPLTSDEIEARLANTQYLFDTERITKEEAQKQYFRLKQMQERAED